MNSCWTTLLMFGVIVSLMLKYWTWPSQQGHHRLLTFTVVVPETVHSTHDFRLAIIRLHIICEESHLTPFTLKDNLLHTRTHTHTHTHTQTATLSAERQESIAWFIFKSLPSPTEMAGHYKGGEVSAEDPAPQQYRVQRLLPPWAHSMGECLFTVHAQRWKIISSCYIKGPHASSTFSFASSWWWNTVLAQPPIC